ncbi:hypothetical protein [Desulfolutivibrio sulfoxidireducens]|uniref:hypothetical protein n=1 Tax=Desulfolutivibrio sulfoxidireducens TaxID=2773299 RepID=UPI00159DC36A|nr:hypothetical protein [Desulfolutivibrio sulfoxidireducens]QLA15931.1 hypothetical protein GD605_07115 [Desulfolutivibrio sulfoxidireducens]
MPRGFWQGLVLIGFFVLSGQGGAMAAETGNQVASEQKPAVTGQAPATASPAAPEAVPATAAPTGQAAPDKKGGQKAAKPGHPVPGSPAVQATEQRYQDYLDREKAASEAGLAKQRGKIEDKYKGFVRTVKPRGKKSGEAEKPAK